MEKIYYELGKISFNSIKVDVHNMYYYNKRVLVELNDAGITIHGLSNKAYIKDLISKKYFYYIFMQNMNFDAQWEDFMNKLNEWINLRESE